MSKSASGKRRASESFSEDAPASKTRRFNAEPAERGASSNKDLAPIFRPAPEPIHISSPIEDRQSTFVGRIYRITAAKDTEYILANHNTGAEYNMAAWRIVSLKPGRTGLAGPDDFRVESASRDDGEQWGGKRILGTMEKEGVSDALVIVSRWYGGVLLGPVRFTHIEQCAREVCQFFKSYEEVEELVVRLTALDDELAELRALLAARTRASANTDPGAGRSEETPSRNNGTTGGTAAPAAREDGTGVAPRLSPADPGNATAPPQGQLPQVSPSKRPQSYDRLLAAKPPDVGTAQRLVKAREKAVESVKAILSRGGAAASGSIGDGK